MSNFHFVLIQSATPVPSSESASVWGPSLVGDNGFLKGEKDLGGLKTLSLAQEP